MSSSQKFNLKFNCSYFPEFIARGRFLRAYVTEAPAGQWLNTSFNIAGHFVCGSETICVGFRQTRQKLQSWCLCLQIFHQNIFKFANALKTKDDQLKIAIPI